jgi:transposase InsO family protein
MLSQDITYIDLKNGKFCYATFVGDEHNREILGHTVTSDMKAESISPALLAALAILGGKDVVKFLKLIHHSDKGSQYTSSHFRAIFAEYNIRVSMTENGNGWENPGAERVNGIIKNELLIEPYYDTIEEAKKAIDNAVYVYNNIRLHMSCDMMTPVEARDVVGPQKKVWKNYKKKPSE